MSSDDLAQYRFSRTVLLEMAVAIEKSAKDFYSTLSEKFSDHKALFQQLAKDEYNHAQTYEKLLKTVGEKYQTGGEKVEIIYPTKEERKLADQNIQTLESLGIIGNLRKGAERARKVSDLKSALEISIQQEKDTLLFYHNMTMALDERERQEVNKIINVEITHLYKVQHITL